MSGHVYVVVPFPHIDDAITKGLTDYDQPQYNRAIRYNLNASKVMLEGLFFDEEIVWFYSNGLVFNSIDEARDYIHVNRAEWETSVCVI